MTDPGARQEYVLSPEQSEEIFQPPAQPAPQSRPAQPDTERGSDPR